MSEFAKVELQRQRTDRDRRERAKKHRTWLSFPQLIRRRRGFTYVELVTVLLLLGVLSAIATKALVRSKSRAFAAVVESDLRSLVVAQEDYFAESSTYFDGGGATLVALPALDLSATPGVSFELRGDAAGWAGRAVHEKLIDRDFACSFYTGQVEPYPPAVQEGVVTCRSQLSGGSDPGAGNKGNKGNKGKGNNGKGNNGNNGKGNNGNNGKGNNGNGNGNSGNGNGNNGNGNNGNNGNGG
ncbi:MAG: prepilin-type N-terminal cleavage/methylation domain-containing protein [Gemmatimonadales bacterium]|jgi:prepilin-type N-terminal cleavage/methylation domain-containing protein